MEASTWSSLKPSWFSGHNYPRLDESELLFTSSLETKVDIGEEYGSEYLFGIIVGCEFSLYHKNVRPFYTIFLAVTEYQGLCTFVVLITL